MLVYFTAHGFASGVIAQKGSFPEYGVDCKGVGGYAGAPSLPLALDETTNFKFGTGTTRFSLQIPFGTTDICLGDGTYEGCFTVSVPLP